MNRFIPRFWCRVLCPLGAFLGVFAKFALFGMEKDHAKCTDCNLCLVNCQGADSPQGGVKWRQDECHMCLNCETACPEDVIKFRFLPNRKSASAAPALQRRTLLATAAAGAAFIPVARIADSIDVNYHAKVIRPPGAVEERAFLERCIRCAECMKVCPNNALHPAFFEAGESKASGRPSSLRASATASTPACSAARSARPAPSRRSPRRRSSVRACRR